MSAPTGQQPWPVRLTPEQAAAYCGIDPLTGEPQITARSILALVRAGRLPALRIARQVLILREDLDALIESRSVGGER